MTDIEAVITDVGGVLNHTEFARFADALTEHCSATKKAVQEVEHRTRVYELDAGKITAEEYVQRLHEEVGLRLGLTEYRGLLHDYIHWHSNLISHYDGLDHPVYILSNNSTLFITDEKRKDLEDVFDAQFYSHEIGARKPNDEIYEYALERIKEPPRRCVFVDDKQRNLDAAEDFDVQTHLFTGQDDLLSYLDELR